MTEQQNRGPHRWRAGESGNRAGRPKGQSVSAELKRIADPEKIARYVYEVATDASAPAKDRQWAVTTILDRLEGRPVSTLEMRARVESLGVGILPSDFFALDAGQRARVLDEVRHRALLGASTEVIAVASAAGQDEP